MAETLTDRINDQLIRLGYSTFSGDRHGFEACPDGNPAIVVMGHHTQRFDVMAYHAEALLAALKEQTEGIEWPAMQAVLAAHAVEE
jgi:hypothetical protein